MTSTVPITLAMLLGPSLATIIDGLSTMAFVPLEAMAPVSPPSAELPGGLAVTADMSPWLQGLFLALGTLMLEDATAIAAGVLADRGTISLSTAMLGTGVGIYLGDLGLYLLGAAAARGARGTGWIRRRLPSNRLERISRWFATSGWKAIVFSRFVSGSRLPIYLGAGFTGAGFGRFAGWTFLAVLVWTPLVVGATALLGHSLTSIAERTVGTGWLAGLVVAVLLIACMQMAILLLTNRRTLAIRCARAVRFEFWPTWAIYAPIIPWAAWNALRHGGFRTITAVNPCWPDSGMIGDSKQAGLDALDPQFVSPSFLLSPDASGHFDAAAIDAAVHHLAATGWTGADPRRWAHPVVVKPDAGARGFGVKVIGDELAFRALLGELRSPHVVQRFEPGACEVGLFFIRDPGATWDPEAPGRLFSICHKRFQHVVGDGHSTLRELIMRDRRLRLQESVFFDRFEARLDDVLPAGMSLRMGNAGNHAQGCLFVDGEDLRTPALERWVVQACARARGFHYGRLDVRFADEDACRRGDGGMILEVNGVASESTNMYDPSFGALRAWRIMRRHWSAAFRIGAAQRAAGVHGLGLCGLLRRRSAWQQLASRPTIAD
jgi:membrane protein DedA with SNARE-associated domain